MAKYLFPIAGVLAWSVGLAALSGFDAMDADRDGAVSAREHAAAATSMFKAMDANRDGKVTEAEMDAAQQKITGKPAHGSDLASAEKIRMVDRDGDGVLSSREHRRGSRALFRKMDTDGNGSLSKAEFDAGHAVLSKKER